MPWSVSLAPAAHRLPRDGLGQGRRPPSPQEADRRRGPVRRGVPAHRTAAAGRGFRVRRRGEGRHDPRAVHAGRREGRAAGAAQRRGGGLSDPGRARCSSYDGKHHPVDSKEVAFVAAGKKAFLDACIPGKARPQVLEPIVELEVERARAAHGRCQRRPGEQARAHQRHRQRARQRDRGEGAGAAVGTGRLRGGAEVGHRRPRALFVWTSATTSRCPANVQQKLVEAYKPRHEEESTPTG